MDRFDFLLNKNENVIEYDVGNDSTIFNMYMNPNKNITHSEYNITTHPKFKDSYSDTIDILGFSLINKIEDMLLYFVSDMVVLHRDTIKDIIDFGLPKIEECGYVELNEYKKLIMKNKTPRECVQDIYGPYVTKINKDDVDKYLKDYKVNKNRVYVYDCWDISNDIRYTLENIYKYMIDNGYDYYIYAFAY